MGKQNTTRLLIGVAILGAGWVLFRSKDDGPPLTSKRDIARLREKYGNVM
jgi:hypothetical protein